jgi:hypothetical protein
VANLFENCALCECSNTKHTETLKGYYEIHVKKYGTYYSYEICCIKEKKHQPYAHAQGTLNIIRCFIISETHTCTTNIIFSICRRMQRIFFSRVFRNAVKYRYICNYQSAEEYSAFFSNVFRNTLKYRHTCNYSRKCLCVRTG